MRLYGAIWSTNDPVAIELAAIRAGGYWVNKAGATCGRGLEYHYQQLESLLAPWKKWDRWSCLILREVLTHSLTVLTGPASSTKTHNAAFYALIKYMAQPTNQCVLVTSTDSRSLELRVWGEIKKLWADAKRICPDMPGRIIESRQMIVTDVQDSEATDYRNGIIGLPCVQGGSYVGLGKMAGIKNGNLLLIADELSYMSQAFYDSISNLRKNPGFQCIGIGNPKDRTDVLGRLAEPATDIGGWEGYEPTGKTYTYPTRFSGGIAIVLDGRDSPNNDTPPGEKPLYPYIITKDKIDEDVVYYGEESIQVSMFDYGIFPKDAQARRVITRSICERYRAFDEIVWASEVITKLFALDAAYGAVGGDRCVGVYLAFGRCSDGVTRLAFMDQPVIIPVSARKAEPPENQIALWVKTYCEDPARQIPASHVAFDSTGRGSLVSAFARNWSADVVAVEFGGPATTRPVSSKVAPGKNQPRTCKDAYTNFVTELWFTSRVVIESDQLRRLPVNVMEEGCMRGWDPAKNGRVEVEPKDKTKLRMNRSPDLYDSFVVGIELARRLGFTPSGMLSGGRGGSPAWLRELISKQRTVGARRTLKAPAA